MFIRVERERHSVARDVATEAVHRGNRALIRIESGKDTAARIVDVGHQRTPGPTPLAPVRVRAVQLDQFPHVGLPSPPCPVRLLPPCGLRDPARPQPLPQGLGTERDPMPLGQLLRRKGRPTVPLVLPIPPQHLRLQRGPVSSVRGLASTPMYEPRVAFGPDPLAQPPHLTRRAPQHLAGLPLPQGLAHRLPDHMHPLQLLHTHTHRVRSDHTALPLRAASLYKRTFLLWQKRPFSCWDYSNLPEQSACRLKSPPDTREGRRTPGLVYRW